MAGKLEVSDVSEYAADFAAESGTMDTEEYLHLACGRVLSGPDVTPRKVGCYAFGWLRSTHGRSAHARSKTQVDASDDGASSRPLSPRRFPATAAAAFPVAARPSSCLVGPPGGCSPRPCRGR
ncbi:hypothetical protein GCM10010121_071820 [Streptomyces brasiliensis]|uniref:Uncharacterized protein n=1 Tax=Streptomyces brasiliensis TaxID=1954 RepID=A0A917L7R4_9ACTN|nr:hypothetical protein GCM10010121_071820 [Streptomyces brasiliensis]